MCWSVSWLMVPIAHVVCAVMLDWEQWLVTRCGAAIQRDPESVLWKSWVRAGTTGSASLLFWGHGFPSNLYGYTERVKSIPPYGTKVKKKKKGQENCTDNLMALLPLLSPLPPWSHTNKPCSKVFGCVLIFFSMFLVAVTIPHLTVFSFSCSRVAVFLQCRSWVQLSCDQGNWALAEVFVL